MNEMILTIPLKFHTSLGAIMKHGRDLGRENGLDSDWEPAYIEEALFEILLFDAHGYLTPLPVHGFEKKDAVLSVKIHLVDPQDTIRQCIIDDGIAPQTAPFEDCLVGALMSSGSPADFGFEIIETILPNSGHHKIKAAAAKADMHNA